jgi:hypothetical protein
VCFVDFRRAPRGARVFHCAPHDDHDYTRATRSLCVPDSARTSCGSDILAKLMSPLGCVRATDTASTSAITVGEGRTGGTFGQSSSDDHAGEARLPATE